MGDLRPIPSGLTAADASVITSPHPIAPHPIALDVARSAPPSPSLKILHIFRAPLGGLFRHVIDLVKGQSDRGHRVGLILDSTTGGPHADAALDELAPCLALGFRRVAIPRHISPLDIEALRYVSHIIKPLGPDVLHGHGAKGGALARLVPGHRNAIRVYTPHGGSLIHRPGSLSSRFYLSLERVLNYRTDLFLFESGYIAELYRTEIDQPRALAHIVRNGVSKAEFEPITPRDNATDIVSVGELRPIKSIDLLIDAVASLNRSGRHVSATIAGDGPEAARLKAQTEQYGISDRVRFIGHCPAREAFALGRIFVIPSRAESLPYVLLEALAAGMPTVATDVGDASEVFGPQAQHLIPPNDLQSLASAITAALDDLAQARRNANAVRARLSSHFSVDVTVESGLAGYREAIATRRNAQFT